MVYTPATPFTASFHITWHISAHEWRRAQDWLPEALSQVRRGSRRFGVDGLLSGRVRIGVGSRLLYPPELTFSRFYERVETCAMSGEGIDPFPRPEDLYGDLMSVAELVKFLLELRQVPTKRIVDTAQPIRFVDHENCGHINFRFASMNHIEISEAIASTSEAGAMRLVVAYEQFRSTALTAARVLAHQVRDQAPDLLNLPHFEFLRAVAVTPPGSAAVQES